MHLALSLKVGTFSFLLTSSNDPFIEGMCRVILRESNSSGAVIKSPKVFCFSEYDFSIAMQVFWSYLKNSYLQFQTILLC